MAHLRAVALSSGGAAAIVTPPAPTSQATAAGVGLAAVTFGAFTDSSSEIASYTAVTTTATGSAVIS